MIIAKTIRKKNTGKNWKRKTYSFSQMINQLHIKCKRIYEQTVLTELSKFAGLTIKPHESTVFLQKHQKKIFNYYFKDNPFTITKGLMYLGISLNIQKLTAKPK